MKILFLVLLFIAVGDAYYPWSKTNYRDSTDPFQPDHDYMASLHCQFIMRCYFYFGTEPDYWIPKMQELYGGEDKCIDYEENKKLWKDVGVIYHSNIKGHNIYRFIQTITKVSDNRIRNGCIGLEESRWWIAGGLNHNKKNCVEVMGYKWAKTNIDLFQKKWSVKKGKRDILCNKYGKWPDSNGNYNGRPIACKPRDLHYKYPSRNNSG